MKNLFELITRFPKITLTILIVITVFLGSQLPKLRMETDAESMIPQDHAAIQYNDQAEELFDISGVLMFPVSVSRFHNHIIRLLDNRGIPEDRLIPAAYVPGEEQGPDLAIVADLERHMGRPEDMAGVMIGSLQALTYLNRLSIANLPE